MWETIIPALASVAGTAINAISADRNIKQTNEAQQRENELAWRRNQQSIREMNQYNSASAQMSRLQAAGLNPNLMYDNGQQSAAGMQDGIAEYQPAQLNPGFAPVGQIGTDAINAMIGLKDLENKTDLTAAEVALKSVQGLNEVTKAGLNSAQTKLILQEWGFKEIYNPLEIEQKRVEIALDRNRSAQVVSEIRKNAYLMREISARTGLSLAETERISGLWLYERDNILSEIHNRKYQNLNLASQAQLAFANSEYLRGMLVLNTKRFYLDETMQFKNFSLNEKKVDLMKKYVDIASERWKLERRQMNYNFWIGDGGRAFSQDMVNIGTGLVNLLGTPLFGSAVTPAAAPIGFR